MGRNMAHESLVGRVLKRIRERRAKYLTITSAFILIIISVILTGVFFGQTDKKAKAKHDSQSGSDDSPLFNVNQDNEIPFYVIFTVELNQFVAETSSMIYKLEGFVFNSSDNNAPSSGPSFCAQIFDTGALDPPSSLTLNPPNGTQNVATAYLNTTTLNVSMDGFLSRYPLDVYTGSISVLTYMSTDGSVPCNDRSYNGNADTIVPSGFSFGQSLSGFVSRNGWRQIFGNETDFLDSDSTAFIGIGTVNLSFHIRRVRVIQFFSLIMFIATWLLTLGVLLATGQVLFHNKKSRFDLVAAGTALLFALPTLRSAQPGIPTTPTIYDTIGYFWNIALLAISTFVLIGHSIYHLEVDGDDENVGCGCKLQQVPVSPEAQSQAVEPAKDAARVSEGASIATLPH